jgi:hypothetical protein
LRISTVRRPFQLRGTGKRVSACAWAWAQCEHSTRRSRRSDRDESAVKWIAHDKTGKDRLDSAFVVLDKKTRSRRQNLPVLRDQEYGVLLLELAPLEDRDPGLPVVSVHERQETLALKCNWTRRTSR